ncbi:carbohydrate esterase [Virgibacillus soli]|uniref:Carbohydrate esterase n=2 Tax=Lederbergia galactosidilytica TaxID=217031 RepID=A0A0Q9XUM5_9BACI|nr:carbohydrate esterase [Lederbergia galactosidilytica]KRG12976.1 carbohydrate esterase [Virgibacillus soli]OAK70202.1 carbohydrate esterase [Lederbergia galactosidilytica]
MLIVFISEQIGEKRAQAIKNQHVAIQQNKQSKEEENLTTTDIQIDKKRIDDESQVSEDIKKKSSFTTALETGKVVYLTFDDGPDPLATTEIISLLHKYNAKATFFMLEPNMANNPELVQKMLEEGHVLGVHGVSHEVSKVYQSPQSFVAEMEQAIGFIEDTTGVETKMVRAPYGSKPYITPPFKLASDQADYRLWDWNIDSVDWKSTNGEYVQNVINQVNQLVGKEPLVVLLHEKPTTAAHLEKLLKYFQENNYEMKAIDETMEPLQFK